MTRAEERFHNAYKELCEAQDDLYMKKKTEERILMDSSSSQRKIDKARWATTKAMKRADEALHNKVEAEIIWRAEMRRK